MNDLTELSTEELDRLIANAAKERVRRQEAHPEEPGADVFASVNPFWRGFTHEALLFVRLCHTGYGWVDFQFDRASLAELLGYLARVAFCGAMDAPEKSPVSKSPAVSGGTVH